MHCIVPLDFLAEIVPQHSKLIHIATLKVLLSLTVCVLGPEQSKEALLESYWYPKSRKKFVLPQSLWAEASCHHQGIDIISSTPTVPNCNELPTVWVSTSSAEQAAAGNFLFNR